MQKLFLKTLIAALFMIPGTNSAIAVDYAKIPQEKQAGAPDKELIYGS